MVTASAPPPVQPTAAQTAEPRIGAMGRIIGVLTSPKETFADIARAPSWLVPLLVGAALGVGFAYVMNERVDWYTFIRQQIERSPRAASMSQEQIAQAARMQSQWSPPFAYAIGICAPFIMALLMALVYWGAFNAFAGIGARFKQALAVASHALLTGLVSAPIVIVIMLLKQRGDVDPENLMASSAASFLGSDAPRWLVSLAGSFELFWFWTMFLLAVGFASINRKKLSTGRAFGIVMGVWLVWVLVKVGATYMFS